MTSNSRNYVAFEGNIANLRSTERVLAFAFWTPLLLASSCVTSFGKNRRLEEQFVPMIRLDALMPSFRLSWELLRHLMRLEVKCFMRNSIFFFTQRALVDRN